MKTLVNSYLATNDIAPQILFYNGPAANAYNSGRQSFYGWNATPTFQIDGLNQQLGWNQTNVQNYINNRLAVPSYCSINVTVVGNASGGTAYYTITAEQALASSLKLYSAIIEDNDIATSAYGYYEGQVLMWEPRAWPAGATGTTISFTGPYPQTLNFNFPYTLNPAEHNFNNLRLIAYVQTTTGNKEVQNAFYMDMPTTATGVYEDGTAPVAQTAQLLIGPNPSTNGFFSMGAVMPQGVTGTISVYDMSGRVLDSFDASVPETEYIRETGVYLVRLETSDGQVVTERCTVLD